MCSVSVLLICVGENVFLLFLIRSHKLCSCQRNNSYAVVFFTTDVEIWWKLFPSLVLRDKIFITSFLILSLCVCVCVCGMLILTNGRSAQAYRSPGRAVAVSWSDFVTFSTRVQRATADRYPLSEKITSKIKFIKYFRLSPKQLN